MNFLSQRICNIADITFTVTKVNFPTYEALMKTRYLPVFVKELTKMNISISDEQYEIAQSKFLESVKKEFSPTDNQFHQATKGSGRTSGTSIVTSSKYQTIKNYIEILERVERTQDMNERVELSKIANSVGLPHWKWKYRLIQKNGTSILQTIGDVALSNHNVKNKKDLKKKN